MFTFINFSSIHLHCQVHQCLLRDGDCTAVSCYCCLRACSVRVDYRRKPLMLFFCRTASLATTGERGGRCPRMPSRASRSDPSPRRHTGKVKHSYLLPLLTTLHIKINTFYKTLKTCFAARMVNPSSAWGQLAPWWRCSSVCWQPNLWWNMIHILKPINIDILLHRILFSWSRNLSLWSGDWGNFAL